MATHDHAGVQVAVRYARGKQTDVRPGGLDQWLQVGPDGPPPQPGAPPQRTACVQSSAPGFSWLWGGWADADRSAEQGFRRRRVVGVLSALMAARPWPWRAVVRERRRSRAWRRS